LRASFVVRNLLPHQSGVIGVVIRVHGRSLALMRIVLDHAYRLLGPSPFGHLGQLAYQVTDPYSHLNA
jgi:hypothetical protein